MGKKDIKVTITLYGAIDINPKVWWDWYIYSKDKINSLDLLPNYIGIRSNSFKTGKVTLLNRTEKKLKKVIDSNEDLESLEILSLPDEFKQAVFDYNISFIRSRTLKAQHISASFDKDIFSNIKDVDEIIDNMKKFIIFESGQIFEMITSECPFFYASKANSASFYQSLKVIKKF